MKIESTDIDGAFLLKPTIHTDGRGFFHEGWNARLFHEIGIDVDFFQDNFSRSKSGVLRGMHYQMAPAQGKLVAVTRGKIFDVAVDLRRSSKTFSKVVSIELDDAARTMLWIPPGCAHGFYVMSPDGADIMYKCSEQYAPESERTIAWNDSELSIAWPVPLGEQPILSGKDQQGVCFANAELFE